MEGESGAVVERVVWSRAGRRGHGLPQLPVCELSHDISAGVSPMLPPFGWPAANCPSAFFTLQAWWL